MTKSVGNYMPALLATRQRAESVQMKQLSLFRGNIARTEKRIDTITEEYQSLEAKRRAEENSSWYWAVSSKILTFGQAVYSIAAGNPVPAAISLVGYTVGIASDSSWSKALQGVSLVASAAYNLYNPAAAAADLAGRAALWIKSGLDLTAITASVGDNVVQAKVADSQSKMSAKNGEREKIQREHEFSTSTLKSASQQFGKEPDTITELLQQYGQIGHQILTRGG